MTTAAAFVIAPRQQNHQKLSTALCAKKVAKAKKIQVKLLKTVEGTGQKGDVVQVTPAFFQNKLQRTQSAEIISDEEVEKMESEKEAAEKEEQEKATSLKEALEEKTITITRKAGPDGQLFGGIGPKVIMDEVQNILQDDFLNQKGVKIAAIMDENGKKMRSDIKHTGDFAAKLALAKNIAAEFKISVLAEE
jgi:large subunit ribosomal protein L9